jgi:hypothetical protein
LLHGLTGSSLLILIDSSRFCMLIFFFGPFFIALILKSIILISVGCRLPFTLQITEDIDKRLSFYIDKMIFHNNWLTSRIAVIVIR